MRNAHVLELFNSFEDKQNLYLVLEYCENGNLYTYIREKEVIEEKKAFIFFFQTALAMEYLHSQNVIHRDLKPENLLLDKNLNIKISDFGWSTMRKREQEMRSTFCGTVDYMAPEMVKNKKYDFKVDIWSLGVLLYELTQKKAPFRGKNIAEKSENIVKGRIEPYTTEVNFI